MKLEQLTYPFPVDSNGEFVFQRSTDDINKRAYKHLGIERPHTVPLTEISERWIDNEGLKLESLDWPIIVEINSFELGNAAYQEHRFYISEQEKFEIKINNGEAIRIKLSPQEQQNKYLVINASYEIAN